MDPGSSLTFEDNKWLPRLMFSVYDLQKVPTLCDVTITDGEGNTSMAHSCILAGSSWAFASMFKNGHSAASSSSYACEFGVTTDTIRQVLEFIYTGQITVPDTSSLTQVFIMASELKISSLVDWCTGLGIVNDGDIAFAADSIDRDDLDVAVKSETDAAASLDGDKEKGLPPSSAASSDTEIESELTEGAVKEEASDTTDETDRRRTTRANKKQSHQCTICGRGFHYASHLLNHKQKKHKGQIQKGGAKRVAKGSRSCDKVLKTREPYDVRERVAPSSEKQYSCEQCGAKFGWPGSLQKHWKTHTDWKPYACKHCSERFSTGKDMRAHKQEKHDRKFQCHLCDKVLTTMGKLTEHTRRHINARDYICCVCGARFNTKSQLTQHEVLHLGLKPFKCDLCPKTCGSQRHLDEHKSSHSNEKPYACQYCGKRQKYMSGLRAHEKLHLFGKTISCETCGKKFATTSQLKQHMTRHTGEKRHKCTLCGQRFTCASAKRRHEFAHTGMKPFPCHTCGKMFADKRDVREHEKIHAADKPEQCQQCGKCFHTTGGLKAHSRTHQDDSRELYYCSVCHKTFMRSHNRNIHEVNIHGLPPRKRHMVPVIISPELAPNPEQLQQEQMQSHDTSLTGDLHHLGQTNAVFANQGDVVCLPSMGQMV